MDLRLELNSEIAFEGGPGRVGPGRGAETGCEGLSIGCKDRSSIGWALISRTGLRVEFGPMAADCRMG